MVSILVVDDEPTVRFMLVQMVRRVGYDSIPAASVADAKKLLSEKTFALILTDINMPGESGLDLIRHVHDKFPETGVVVVTIIDDPVAAQEILELGVYGYIIKPFTQNIVHINIENALRRQHLEQKERMQTELLQQELARQTESAHEQVNFLQTLIDSIPISVYYKDREARYLGCNKAFESIVERSKQEIIGKTARQIYTPELAERFCEQDRQLLDKGGSEYLEVDLQDQKDTTHHTILQKASFCNSGGHITGVIGIGIDISNLKNIENKLRESEEQLRAILNNLPVGVISSIESCRCCWLFP